MSQGFVVVRTLKTGTEPELLERTDDVALWWSNSPNHPQCFPSAPEAEALLERNDYLDHPDYDVVVLPFAELRIVKIGGSKVLLPVR